jgi:hypothetical protein
MPRPAGAPPPAAGGPPATELADYVDPLAKAGIVRAVPFGTSNDQAAALVRDYPDRFIGLAPTRRPRSSISPCASIPP